MEPFLSQWQRMKEIRLQKWAEFAPAVTALYAESKSKGGPGRYVSPLLFRGHSQSSWPLDTTLERRGFADMSVIKYLRIVTSLSSQVSAVTDRSWSLPDFSEMEHQVHRIRQSLWAIPAYEYLIYLRHHGFPSPLLDWSASPYVAAFFAFHGARTDDDVAIYAYLEYAGAAKVSSDRTPTIRMQGPYAGGHRRHYLQQSSYTICTVWNDNEMWFASHAKAFSQVNEDQDLTWKITLPSSERRLALKSLDQYNLNAYSLFHSEESLLETIAMREFELYGM